MVWLYESEVDANCRENYTVAVDGSEDSVVEMLQWLQVKARDDVRVAMMLDSMGATSECEKAMTAAEERIEEARRLSAPWSDEALEDGGRFEEMGPQATVKWILRELGGSSVLSQNMAERNMPKVYGCLSTIRNGLSSWFTLRGQAKAYLLKTRTDEAIRRYVPPSP